MIGKLFSNIRHGDTGSASQVAAGVVASSAAQPPSAYFHEMLTGQLLIDSILAQPAHADPKRLERHGWKAYSQHDEDGILQEIFRRIGAPHRSFVEFGCGFGLENNTAYLLSQGWRGLWMDGDAGNIAAIRSGFGYLIDHGLLRLTQAFITRDNIDALIAAADLGPEIDLLSIDLDGNDYYIWEAIRAVDARVVVIEYNAKFRPPHDWCITYNPEQLWDGSDRMGSSLTALARLGAAKGYRLVGCGIAGGNAFFVRRDLTGDLFAAPDTPEHLYQPPRYFLSRYFSSGHPGNSFTVVESASLGAQLPWPPATPLASIVLANPGA